MTAAARITQDDMTRAAKAVRLAGFEHARIVMDLVNGRIEVIIGEAGGDSLPSKNPWDDL